MKHSGLLSQAVRVQVLRGVLSKSDTILVEHHEAWQNPDDVQLVACAEHFIPIGLATRDIS
jgi:hypothetical protein